MNSDGVSQRCPLTGLYIVQARGQEGWRVAQERYTRSGGILAVRKNEHVGPLPSGVPERRGRFDTVGRTVYFAAGPETAFAEVLQDFRAQRVAVEADAEVIGLTIDAYMAEVREQAVANGLEIPWAISVSWQMSRCIHRVKMPARGWWVQIDHKVSLNRLGLDLARPLREMGIPMLTLGGTAGESREVTTLLAEHVRGLTLFDGTLPLGIQFSSKTGYGTCWAWWNRSADAGRTPEENDPKTIEDLNVDGAALRKIARDWHLELLPGLPSS